jgi:5-methylcytosine-specific restriction protein A
MSVSTVADHYPQSKKELRDLNLDDNAPSAGRGLCARCHAKYTFQIEGR